MNTLIELINNEEGTYQGDLRHYYKVLWKAGNIAHPYHNMRHMQHVMWHTHRAARVHTEITVLDIRLMLIAALFHDYNHRGTVGNDAENIAIAIEAMKENLLEEDKQHADTIALYITATQFPHLDGDFPIQALLLRDVDIASTLNDVWMQMTIIDMGKEFGSTPEAMLKMQIPFLTIYLKFSTEWAEKEYRSKIEDRLVEVRKMMECLGIPED